MKNTTAVLVCLYIALLIASFSTSSAAQVPQIETSRIVFNNGKVLEIKQEHVVHSNRLEAYRKHEPIRYREQAVLIEEWQRIVVNKHLNFFDQTYSELRVYNYEGRQLNPARKFRGKVIVAAPTERIFLGQHSRNYLTDKSFLLDSNGNLVKEITQSPNAFDFGSSPDGKLIWIFARLVRDQQPYIQLKIIDHEGNTIKTHDFNEEQTLQVEHDGKSYDIAVPIPGQ